MIHLLSQLVKGKRKTNEIDFLIPCHAKDLPALKLAVEGIRKIQSCRNIYIISNFNPALEKTIHVNESEFDGLITLKEIENIWRQHYAANAHRAGWIYQQFLKLLSFRIIQELSDSFVVVDADTIFLRDVRFDPRKYYYCKTKEFHEPYTDPIRELLGVARTIGFSCICHHSIFNKSHLAQMFKEIEARHSQPFCTAVLNHINFAEPSCFSEWDLYANYMLLHHAGLSKRRQLKWSDIKEMPSSDQLSNYAKKYDFVSCHAYLRAT